MSLVLWYNATCVVYYGFVVMNMSALYLFIYMNGIIVWYSKEALNILKIMNIFNIHNLETLLISINIIYCTIS